MSTLEDVREALHADPMIAKRAKFWGDKYIEDRTRSIEERTKIIQMKLATEFPAIGRKGARFMAEKITRDW